MKDSYSFDRDEEGVDESFEKNREAYHRIFERCGLEVHAVQAECGMMGGSESASTSSHLPARARTRSFAARTATTSADLEIAHAVPRAPEFPEPLDAPEEIDTPGVTTIEGLAELLGHRRRRRRRRRCRS